MLASLSLLNLKKKLVKNSLRDIVGLLIAIQLSNSVTKIDLNIRIELVYPYNNNLQQIIIVKRKGKRYLPSNLIQDKYIRIKIRDY